MHKARLPSRAFGTFQPEFGNFFQERHRLPCVWQATYGQRRTKMHRPPPPPKRGKLANSFFFLIQVAWPQGLSPKTEFANRGKLSGKLAKSFWQSVHRRFGRGLGGG